MFGALFGRAARGVAGIVVSAVAAELKKPETQQKIGQAAASVQHKLTDPETRRQLETAAGTASKTAARLLGRAAGTIKNKLGSGD